MRRIDGKFHIEGGKIMHVSGVEVPEDEPLFLLRARDWNALRTLEAYRELCAADACTNYQMEGIQNAIRLFGQFAKDRPDRMKQPGITRGAPASGQKPNEPLP